MLLFLVFIIIFNVYFTSFYVKHFEFTNVYEMYKNKLTLPIVCQRK